MNIKLSLISTAAFLLISCSHSSSVVKKDVGLTSGLVAQQYSNIYFSGQPPLDKFKKLKEQGFATVINLRQAEEKNYKEADEKKAVEAAGLTYVNIPMSGEEDLTEKKVDSITNAVVKNRKNGKILIHCSTGNRAGLWAGAHFHKDHHYSKSNSVEIAKELGLDKKELIQKLSEFLD